MDITGELFSVTDEGGYECPACHQGYTTESAIHADQVLDILARTACCDAMEIAADELLTVLEARA